MGFNFLGTRGKASGRVHGENPRHSQEVLSIVLEAQETRVEERSHAWLWVR